MSGAAGERHWVLRELPYVLMLVLAVIGVGITSLRGTTTHYYWMALAPVYGAICVAAGWRAIETTAGHVQLVTTQALHWLAFVAAMWLMFLPEVRGVDNDNAITLALLILLALGTFVAGVHARVWRICAVGAFLALSVPAVAWIQESVMLIAVSLLLVAVVAGVAFWLRARESR